MSRFLGRDHKVLGIFRLLCDKEIKGRDHKVLGTFRLLCDKETK